MYNPFQIGCKTLLPVVLLVIAVLCPAAGLQAQYIRQLNGNQLLGASEIYHIAKDRSGFLWFCTDHGLVKYDGSNIQHYTKQNGLADNMVFNVYEDREGRIWPFCYNGNYCFINNDSVHNEHNDAMLAALPHTGSYIVYMAQAADSTLCMAYLDHTLLHFKIAGNTVSEKITEQAAGKNLFVTKDRVSLSDRAPEYVTVIVPGTTMRLVSDDRGIKIYNADAMTWQLDDPALTGHAVSDLCLTGDGRLLAATSHGLELIDMATKQKKTWLKGVRLSSCIADINGNFWISETGASIYVLQRELNDIHPLPGFDGHDLVPVNDDKQLLVKDNILYELQAAQQGIIPYIVKRNVKNYWNPVLCYNGLTGFYDTWKSYAYIWYGDESAVYRRRIFIKSLHPLGNNRFFMRSGYLSKTLVWNGKQFMETENATYYKQKITALCQHPKTRDVYYVAGDTMYWFGAASSRGIPVLTSPEFRNITGMIVIDSVLLMAMDKDHYYTWNRYWQHANPEKHATGFIVRDFLPLDNKRFIALSGDAAYICALDNATGAFQKIRYPFTTYEHMAILGGNCLVRSDGRYYYFDTSLFNRHVPVRRVYLKQLLVNGKPCPAQKAELRNTKEANVQLSLGMLGFDDGPRDLQYRLTGPNEDGHWHKASAELVLVIGNPGDYLLEVAPGGDDRHDGAVTVLHLVIHTPFMQSLLFYVLCLVLGIVLCVCTAWLILRYRKKMFTKEFNYLRLEHKAINALLNPHFVFNSINNIQGLIHEAEKQEAADYLAILSRLIRQNLENLEHNLVPLSDELELIHRYIKLQNLRFEGNIQLHIDIIQQEAVAVKIPPLLIHTFVENAIVHGYRFRSQPFHIYISIAGHTVADYLRIAIADNGVGINADETAAAAHTKSSMGISFSRKRLARISDFYKLQQSISVKDRSDDGQQGTEVLIILYARLEQLFEQRKLHTH